MKKIISSIALLSVFFGYSQSITDDINNFESSTTFSTPDVYAFEKVNLVDIKKYVGKANINVPIYEIQSGNLKYPISLNYDTGGIKVDQIASDVGLGWSISQTVVTRNINKGNDFNTVGYKWLPGSGYSFGTQLERDMDVSVSQAFKQRLGYFMNQNLNRVINHDERTIDFIPDEYNFYSSEFTTKFFFRTLTNPIELNPQGTIISATKSKIQFDAKIPTWSSSNQYETFYDFPTEDFFSMNITSNKGIKYTFNDYDLATGVDWDYNGSLNYHYANNRLINLNTISVSALHISTIEDLQTGKKINFEYDNTHSNPFNEFNATNANSGSFINGLRNSIKSFSYMRYNADITPGQCFYWTIFSGSSNTYAVNSKICVQKKRLKRITFDEGSVEYKYNNDGGTVSGISNIREDIYNGDFLTKIIVKNNKGDVIKTVEFKYDYFISSSTGTEFNPEGFINPKRYKRLKLKEIKEIGKPAYVFTYEESIKLPPVNSFSIDFLGYYNASPDVANLSQLQSIIPSPKIWYYPNSYDKSVLPFPIPNQPVNLINGYFDRQANINAKAWSLTRVDYPTGGSTELEYESNSFKLLNENITGGGIRVKKQFLNDDNGNQRIIEYSYLDDTGKSSGNLASMPYFGHPANKFFDVGVDDRQYPPTIVMNNPVTINLVNWKLFDRSNLNQDIVSGAYIGYSKVTEREVGRGKTENYFTSNAEVGFQNVHHKLHPQTDLYLTTIPVNPPVYGLGAVACMSNFIMANSAMEWDTFTDNGYKRGRPTIEKVYSESNLIQPIKMSEISYLDASYGSHAFLQPITYPIRTQGSTNLGPIFNLIKQYEVKNYFKTSEKIHTYSNGNDFLEQVNYTYNGIGLLTSKTDILTSKTVETKYYYPQDSQVATEPFISTLNSKNMLSVPIKKEIFTNTYKTGESKVVFANDATTSNLLMPKYMYGKKGDDVNGVLEKKLTKDFIDNKGNVTQYTKENGVPVSLIWGYNKTLLIAKVENATYSSIATLAATAQTASDAPAVSYNETQVISALNAIRTAVPNAMVTSYTHKPLVGVTTVTDPKGDIQNYTYDSNGRLIKVTDKAGLILSENEYYFQP